MNHSERESASMRELVLDILSDDYLWKVHQDDFYGECRQIDEYLNHVRVKKVFPESAEDLKNLSDFDLLETYDKLLRAMYI